MDTFPIIDLESESVEIRRRPARPQQVAEPAEPPLESVRDAFGDLGREAQRGGVEEMAAVDAADVDCARFAAGDDIDRSVEIKRDPKRPREAVRGAERQHTEDGVLADEVIDR
jgi:hypothetical protein